MHTVQYTRGLSNNAGLRAAAAAAAAVLAPSSRELSNPLTTHPMQTVYLRCFVVKL